MRVGLRWDTSSASRAVVRPMSAAIPLPSTADGRLIEPLQSRDGELSGELRSIGEAIGLGRTATGDLLDRPSAAGRMCVETGRDGTRVALMTVH